MSAPGGSGKSALLTDWALRRPVAWLSLDAGDNDPRALRRQAIAALDRVRPGRAERLADDANRHALAAGDAAWAARLVEREVDALLLRGEWGTR